MVFGIYSSWFGCLDVSGKLARFTCFSKPEVASFWVLFLRARTMWSEVG